MVIGVTTDFSLSQRRSDFIKFKYYCNTIVVGDVDGKCECRAPDFREIAWICC